MIGAPLDHERRLPVREEHKSVARLERVERMKVGREAGIEIFWNTIHRWLHGALPGVRQARILTEGWEVGYEKRKG